MSNLERTEATMRPLYPLAVAVGIASALMFYAAIRSFPDPVWLYYSSVPILLIISFTGYSYLKLRSLGPTFRYW